MTISHEERYEYLITSRDARIYVEARDIFTIAKCSSCIAPVCMCACVFRYYLGHTGKNISLISSLYADIHSTERDEGTRRTDTTIIRIRYAKLALRHSADKTFSS